MRAAPLSARWLPAGRIRGHWAPMPAAQARLDAQARHLFPRALATHAQDYPTSSSTAIGQSFPMTRFYHGEWPRALAAMCGTADRA